jgi:hypothetical protein
MKNTQAAFIALAFVLGIGGAFATSAPKAAKLPAPVYWTYSGDQSPAQLNDPAKYTFSPSDPGCTTGSERCAVKANRSSANPAQPDLSTITQEELHN